MDQIILANQQSEVEKKELSNGSKDLKYATAEPYPIFGKSYRVVNPAPSFPAGDPGSKSMTFNIPTGFYNHFARFKFMYTITTADGTEGLTPLAMNLVDYIRFFSNGSQFFEITGAAYRGLVMDLPEYKREYILRYARPMKLAEVPIAAAATTAGAFSYLPLLTSWYTGSFEKSINTSIAQNLSVEIRFRTREEAGLSAALDLFTASLDLRYWKPEDKIYKELLDKNYTNPLTMECWNTLTEVVPLSAGFTTGTSTWQSQCPYNVFKTIVYIAKKNMTVNTVYGCPMQPITSISLTVGGTPYILNYSKSMMDLEGVFNGQRSSGSVPSVAAVANSGNIVTYSGAAAEPIVINWSALGSENSNTGLAFFKELQKPVFDVNWTFTTLGGEASSAYSIYFCHYFWVIDTIAQGSITTSV